MSVLRLSLAELEGLTESADGYRACCPVHGGENATALSIDKTGRYAGVGYCFRCNRVVVLVKELYQPSQDFAAPLDKDRPLRSVRPLQPKEARAWQVEELRLLCSLDQRMRYALAWSPRAREYLEGRGIPLWVAQQIGMGYLSRKVLDDPAYAAHASLLRRWMDAIIFPLSSRVPGEQEGSDSYAQGYIGRTLKLWRSGMNEDEHKHQIDAYNQRVRDHNKEATASQGKRRSSILRWVKSKEPAGFFYPGTPHRVGRIAVLVEGGWDCAAILSCLAQRYARDVTERILPAGSVIGLAGTAAHPQQLPPQVQAVLLALDDDDAGRDRMLLLREDHVHAGRLTYAISAGTTFGKDWSARWCRGGEDALLPLLDAYDYIAGWLDDPRPLGSCLILVDELADALAILAAGAGQAPYSCGLTAGQVVVSSSALYEADWFLPRVQAVVFASGMDGFATGDQGVSFSDPVERARRAIRERALRLRDELASSGIRVYRCPPPAADGLGSTWGERWRMHGHEGVRVLFDAYAYAQAPILKSA